MRWVLSTLEWFDDFYFLLNVAICFIQSIGDFQESNNPLSSQRHNYNLIVYENNVLMWAQICFQLLHRTSPWESCLIIVPAFSPIVVGISTVFYSLYCPIQQYAAGAYWRGASPNSLIALFTLWDSEGMTLAGSWALVMQNLQGAGGEPQRNYGNRHAQTPGWTHRT